MSSYSTDTYSITSTGEETDKIAKHTGSGKQKYIKWILTYSSDGEIQNKAMYTGTEGDEWRHSQSAQKAAGALVITGLGSTVNEAGYYISNIEYVSIDFDRNQAYSTDQVVDRGGLSGEGPPTTDTDTPLGLAAGLAMDVEMEPGLTVAMETAVAESAAAAERAAAAAEPHSALYISSMSQTIRLNRKTGLISQNSFRLKWNDMRYPENWTDDVKNEYNAIQNGEESGTIAIIKENIYLGSDGHKSYNLYYDLNTGPAQKAPTLERELDGFTSFSDSSSAIFNVSYGRVEKSALEAKYKRFEGTYSRGMDLAIDAIVNAARSQMKTKSKYNFKKVDTNKRFKRKNLSLFSEEGRMAETIGVTTATATSTRPMGSTY
tara:strand:- start:3367 stop:4494 length:1128 start_codon:yes stop_codon:yes gene_type:complete